MRERGGATAVKTNITNNTSIPEEEMHDAADPVRGQARAEHHVRTRKGSNMVAEPGSSSADGGAIGGTGGGGGERETEV